jgi:hypothetical protein
MTTAEEIAEWLIAQIRTRTRVSQEEAVAEIRQQFGPEWVQENERGHPAIHKDVLKSFRRAHKGAVHWDRDRRFWSLTE